MRFAVMANPEREECISLAKKIIERMDVIVEDNTARRIGVEGVPIDEINVDVIITIGGDGTILMALQRAKGAILGVNMGVLGFLSEIDPKDIWSSIERIEAGDYILDRRMKLAVWLNDERQYDCTNEVVINTSEVAKLRNYKIMFNGEEVDEIRSDGIIVSTPTGSTSYALSAGGPVLYPSLEGMVIVPLAPFKASTRAFVLPTGTLTLEPQDMRGNLLVLDGQQYVEMRPGDIVKIEKSEQYAEFIRFDSRFFEKIKRRMLVR